MKKDQEAEKIKQNPRNRATGNIKYSPRIQESMGKGWELSEWRGT